jgi:hypothetical protein
MGSQVAIGSIFSFTERFFDGSLACKSHDLSEANYSFPFGIPMPKIESRSSE